MKDLLLVIIYGSVLLLLMLISAGFSHLELSPFSVVFGICVIVWIVFVIPITAALQSAIDEWYGKEDHE